MGPSETVQKENAGKIVFFGRTDEKRPPAEAGNIDEQKRTGYNSTYHQEEKKMNW